MNFHFFGDCGQLLFSFKRKSNAEISQKEKKDISYHFLEVYFIFSPLISL
jgi:hypothetical protein